MVAAVEIVCENGVCRMVDRAAEATNAVVQTATAAVAEGVRIAQGYMSPDAFVAFLNGTQASSAFDVGSWLVVPLAFLGGLAMNLTPCVLPMVPINMMIIGKSAKKGLWYGLGIALTYGILGILSAVGGLAFGTIQSSPWFNLAVAAVFACLALALSGTFIIDFSKYRNRFRGGAFLMGAVAALLAGACVAPILIAVLVLTAERFAAGNLWALALPFVIGLGMGLPWPFVGAGLKVLPKPGAWMKYVNRLFALVVLCFAAWYGFIAYRGFTGDSQSSSGITPKEFPAALAAVKRPVLVDCHASWCKNCAAMERVIRADGDIREALKRYTVISLDAENMDELRGLKGFETVRGLPAFVIFE